MPTRPFSRPLVVASIVCALAGVLLLIWATGSGGRPQQEPALPNAPLPRAQHERELLELEPRAGSGRIGEGGSFAESGDAVRPAAPQAAGILRGRTLDDGGLPLAGVGVRVSAVDAQSRRGAPFPDLAPVGETTSDGQGRFELEAPAATWLRVTATSPGRATAARAIPSRDVFVELRLGVGGNVLAEVFDSAALPAPDVRAVLSSGDVRLESVTDAQGRASFVGVPIGTASLRLVAQDSVAVEDGPFAVLPQSATTRVVFLPGGIALAGTVVDETGDPVVGAEVHVARAGNSTAAGLTDEAGRFGPVPAGGLGERPFVAVRKEGHLPALEPVVLLPPTEGAPMDVEIVLKKGGPWRGRVVLASGEPAVDAAVTTTLDGVAGREPPTVVTDEGGWFSLPPPPPPAPGRRAVIHASLGSAVGALALEGTTHPPAQLEIVLREDAEIGGRFVDDMGRALAGWEVKLIPIWTPEARRGPPDASTSRRFLANERGLAEWASATDDAGRFLVLGVPPGSYQLRLANGTEDRTWPEPIEVGTRHRDLGVLEVGPGWTLEGRVTDGGGTPVPGAHVVARVADSMPPRSFATSADAQGNYRFTGFASDRFALTARAGASTGHAATIDLARNDILDLEVPRSALLEIDATDATGAPVVGLGTIELTAATGGGPTARPRAIRFAAGKATLDDLAPGRHHVALRMGSRGSARSAGPVALLPGERTHLALMLAEPSVVEGIVRTPGESTPVPGAEIHARPLAGDDAGAPSRVVRTDSQGRYRLTDLTAGLHLFTVSGRGGAPVSREAEIVGGAVQVLDFVLDPAARLALVVRDAGGRPVEGARVSFRSAGRLVRGLSLGRTDAAGRLLQEGLPLGFVEVRAVHPERGAGQAEVDLDASTSNATELRLEAPREGS